MLRRAVERLVLDLVAGRYDALEADGRSGRLTANQLRVAIADYGRTLVPIPDQGWALAEVFDHESGGGGPCSIDLPLWTAQEGRSDLTVSLSARVGPAGYEVEVDDLDVL
jgi:hypothetical protein